MSVKLMLQMPTVKDWLESASKRLLLADISTSRLDAEIILSSILGINRTNLHAHPERLIKTSEYIKINKKLNLRANHIPIAYITGKKEFYGRDFKVNKNTLIPRPESEEIINNLKKIIKNNDIINLVDVGTGSGCLGITAKLEFPKLQVTLLDISNKALKIAKLNTKLLSADVKIKKNNLLKGYKEKTDIVIANLPYVDKSWYRSPETDYEPSLALFAHDNGQSLIKKLIAQTNKLLNDNGFLIIEADPSQHESLIKYAYKLQFKLLYKTDYSLSFQLLLNSPDAYTVKS